MAPSETVLTRWYEQHRSFLWGLAYRITGSAADADDIVQDTFVRAHQHAPAHLDEPRRWLMRVAVNASCDVLRRRKKRAYIGPWLPTPIHTDDDVVPSFEPRVGGHTLEGRYDLVESVSLAFLQALEVLTPTQRAVLLLRDVFDYSAGEVASALDLSEGNVRIIHHRSRRAIEAYEQQRTRPTPTTRARTNERLRRFLDLLATGDVRGIERMLAADVKAVTDGGGEFTASLRPIVGARRVAQFFARLAASHTGQMSVVITSVNQFPGAICDFDASPGRRPPQLFFSIDLDRAGLIQHVRVVASSAKLAMLNATTPHRRTGIVLKVEKSYV